MKRLQATVRCLRFAALAAATAVTVACGGGIQSGGPSRGLQVLPSDGALTDATRFYRAMGLASAHMPVAFVGKVSYFASPTPDTTLMLISVSIPARALTFARDDDAYRAAYTVQLRLLRGATEVHRVEATEAVRVASFRETTRTDESVIFQRHLRVAPGTYTVGFSLRDMGGARTSSDTLVATVPRLSAGTLSSAVPVYEVRARQRLDSLPRAVPRPRSTAVFGRDSLVNVYVEAYGTAATVPLMVTVRGEGDAMLWSDTSALSRRGALLSGAVDIPVARLGVGVATVAFTRLDTRDSSITPVFVSFGDELPVAPFEDMLAYLRFFASPSRLAALRSAAPEERGEMWIDFLRDTDPDPGTSAHEGLRDYFMRIQLANDRFRGDGVGGWLSDRGMVFVALGDPDQVVEQLANIRDRRSGMVSRIPVQIWEYRDHRVQLVFVDEHQTGRWELTPSSENEFRSLSGRLLAR